MKIRILSFFTATCLLSQTAFAQVGEFSELIKRAEKGDAEAQFKIAGMYSSAVGAPKDLALAAKWFAAAAEKGHREAQYNLGAVYEYGLGVPMSETNAFAWYRKAASQGQAQAQEKLRQKTEKSPPKEVETIELAKHLRELGFEDDKDALGVGGNSIAGTGRAWIDSQVINKKTGAKLKLRQSATVFFGIYTAGSRFEISASPQKSDQDALLALAKRLSSELHEASLKCLASFTATSKEFSQEVGKLKVLANKEGLKIQTIPAVLTFEGL